MMEQYIGKMLDNRYEILEIIGRGGMAVVFKAKCHRLNRLVAVKVLKPELADDAEFRRRFHDESQAVAMLSHPNIVSVYDVSRGGDLEYIVMELIDGITLKQYIQRRKQLNWRESLHFITQVMKGLSHAHSRGIIHRDIKPQNIMILRDGSVKVADFGIARLMERSGQTRAGSEALGSVHYISPEQAKGERVDERSDIYSAGVVLYEMLTNRLPFEGENAVSIAIQHFSAAPLNPRDINPSIPVALEKICLKAMAPQVNNRYSTADDMIDDLEEFRKNPEVEFSYDVAVLRGENIIDEPTQLIDRKDIQKMTGNKKETYHDTYQDTEEKRSPASILKKVFLVLGALLISYFVITSLYHVIFESFMPQQATEYAVPNLVGMQLEEAYLDPRVEGLFTIKVIAQRESDVPEGKIIEQDPTSESTVKNDRTIEVVVSKGIPTDEMPNLKDQEKINAKLVLEKTDLDLTITFDEEYNDTVPEGHVISTVPREGATIKDGDEIVLTVSLGPKPQAMIRFTGMTRANAESVVAQMGLKATFVEVPSNEVEAGIIMDQSIAAESTVRAGDSVILTVSSGPQTVPEPEPDPDGTGETGQNGDGTTTPDGENPDGTEPTNPVNPDASGTTVPTDTDNETMQQP